MRDERDALCLRIGGRNVAGVAFGMRDERDALCLRIGGRNVAGVAFGMRDERDALCLAWVVPSTRPAS